MSTGMFLNRSRPSTVARIICEPGKRLSDRRPSDEASLEARISDSHGTRKHQGPPLRNLVYNLVPEAEGDRRRVAAIAAKIAADQQRGRGGGRGGGTGAAEEPNSTAAEQVRQTGAD